MTPALRTLAAWPRRDAVRRVSGIAFAFLLLNFLLSFDNWWPTPAIWPDARVAPELIYAWAALLVLAALRGPLSPRGVALFSVVYLVLVAGRYGDVTVPALFGRPVNLYWDGQQVPRFLWVSAKGLPLWQSLAFMAALVLLVWGLYRAIRWAFAVIAREAVPVALRSRLLLGFSIAAVGVALANLAGWQASWPYISRPVLPTYVRQAVLLGNAFLPGRLDKALPASPAFDTGVQGLQGADVKLVMLESYGAVAFDNPRALLQLAPARAALAAQIARNGQQVVSAYVRSPTFGGASDLAHLTLLSGIDLSNALHHDLLLTSARPTLISFLRSRGYETVGLYPALSWDWDERRFYAFDRFYDARHLGYRGPRLGYWLLPDQFSMARLEQLSPVRSGSPPRMVFFASITSHFPFHPVPPYQDDWSKVLSGEPFDAADLARALAEKVDWMDMFPAYLRMIEYNYRWLAGHLAQPRQREELLILVGDHQPAANVSGEGAPWDVPVHIVSANPRLLQAFGERGFRPGLEPQRPVLGALHDLTAMLLAVFDTPALPRAAPVMVRQTSTADPPANLR